MRSLSADDAGASVIEFALLLPLLVFGCMATVDLGLALNQKMEMDRSLRAGAEGLMAGNYESKSNPEEKVKDLVEAIASESLAVADTQDGDVQTGGAALKVTVNRFCMCPENLAAEVSCSGSVSCANSAKRFKFYRISATMDYASMYLPVIPLSGSILVQIE